MYQIKPHAISLFRSWFAISEQPTEILENLPRKVCYYGRKFELACYLPRLFMFLASNETELSDSQQLILDGLDCLHDDLPTPNGLFWGKPSDRPGNRQSRQSVLILTLLEPWVGDTSQWLAALDSR